MKKQYGILLVLLFLAGLSTGEDEVKGRSSIDFIHSTVEIEAMGVPPTRLERGSSAAYADALTAARVMTGSNLAELLSGLYVQTSTSFSDSGATEFVSQVRAELKRTHIPGGIEVRRTSYEEFQRSNQVWVIVRYELRDTISILMRSGHFAQHLQEQERNATPAPPPVKIVVAEAKAKEPDYDGLIVTVPNDFKPTIAPKIFNGKDQLLYGASFLSLDILVSQGAAQFTDTVAKAKASLESRGARLPLVVNGMLRGSTDALVGDEDASHVLLANGKTRFLQRGLVFFVITSKP